MRTPVKAAWLAIAAVVLFTFPTSNATAGAAEVLKDRCAIFWASQPVNPGEVAVLYGGGFPRRPRLELWRLPDDKPGSATKQAPQPLKRPTVVKPVQASEVCLKFVVPEDLARGAFACRLEGGISNTVILNRADARWVQGDLGPQSSPGGWARVFGTCIGLGDKKPIATLVGENGREQQAPVSQADAYSLTLVLAESLPEGEYEVRVHNGYGGKFGWSEALPLTVRKRVAWSATVFNVKDFGARGTGDKDDTEAIRRALAEAERNGGGIVFVPRGLYQVNDTLDLPRCTILQGEGRELSALFWPDRETPLQEIIHGSGSFAVQDLTINCYNYRHVIDGGVGHGAEAGDIFLRRLRIRAMLYRPAKDPAEVDRRFRAALELSSGGGDTIRLSGRNVEITDCDVYGSGRALFLTRVRGGLVARNVFRNGRWGWYCISGSDGLIFENNEIAGGDLMSTGGGINCLDGSTYSQNVYFAHNLLRDMYGWDREALTSDAGGGAYFGAIESARGEELVLAAEPKWGGRDWRGAGVFILDGRGAGQYRRIVDYEGRRVKLDRAWDIAPDETAQLSLTMLQRNYLIVGNEFRDATCAVQFYGISIDHLVANNTSIRAGGFHNLGLHYAGGYQPSWFVQYHDNEILEGAGLNGPLNEYPPQGSHLAAIGGGEPPYRGPLLRATLMRRNRLHNNAAIEVRGTALDVLLENNVVESAALGIRIDANAQGVVLHHNDCRKVNQPLLDEGGKAVIVEAGHPLVAGRPE